MEESQIDFSLDRFEQMVCPMVVLKQRSHKKDEI